MKPDDSSCAEAVEALSDYLAGALLPRQARSLKRHLESCPACFQTLFELRLTLALLSRLPRHAAPQRIKDLLLERISPSKPSTPTTESVELGSS